MRKGKLWIFLLALLMLVPFFPAANLEAKLQTPQLSNAIVQDPYRIVATHGNSYLAENNAGKRLLYLEGDAYERGFAEGYLLPEAVQRMTYEFASNVVKNWTVVDLRDVLVPVVCSQEYAIPREFREEMRGMAEGAQCRGYDVRYEDVLVVNAGFDVLMSAIYQASNLLCNQYAVFGNGTVDGHLYHGRDFMFTTGGGVFCDEVLLKVVRPTEGYPFAAAAAPGMAGIPTGLNIQGVSSGMDMVPSRLNRPLISGMGTLLLNRKVVQFASTLQEGIATVRQASRGASWLYLIADGKEPNAVVLETVSDQVLPHGDDLMNTALNLVPGLDSMATGIDEVLPVLGLVKAAGGVVTGSGELVEEVTRLLPGLGDLHPDRGVAVRTADYVDPPGLEDFRLVLPIPDKLTGLSEETALSPFPLQMEDKPDLIAMTNHFILPQMNYNQMGIFYHTVVTTQGGGRESEWRYETMMEQLLKYYGHINRQTAMWLIDFLNPARIEYYGTETNREVGGHIVLMDNHNLDFWVLHGYYHHPWQHVNLKNILGDSGKTSRPVAVTGVSLDHETLTLRVGDEPFVLKATVFPEDAGNKALYWESGNEAVATVSEGAITPLKPGTTQVTVTTVEGGFTACCEVKVISPASGKEEEGEKPEQPGETEKPVLPEQPGVTGPEEPEKPAPGGPLPKTAGAGIMTGTGLALVVGALFLKRFKRRR